MKLPVEEVVKFHITHDSMISESRTILTEFKKDQTAFGVFDKDFKTPYDTEWETKLKAAEETPSDIVVKAGMKVSSVDVETEMSHCRDCFQGAKFFIEKAFPLNPAIWHYFGYNEYEHCRNNHDRMPGFMTDFSTAANKYDTELIAVNFTDPMITNILVIRDELNAKLSEQHQLITERPLATQNRVHLLNEVWGIRQNVGMASKIVFKDDVAKYRIYLLPAYEEVGTIFNFSGTVTELSTGIALENATITLGGDIPVIISDSNGKFGGALIPDGVYTAHIVLDGYLSKNIPVTIVKGEIFVAHIELEKYHEE